MSVGTMGGGLARGTGLPQRSRAAVVAVNPVGERRPAADQRRAGLTASLVPVMAGVVTDEGDFLVTDETDKTEIMSVVTTQWRVK